MSLAARTLAWILLAGAGLAQTPTLVLRVGDSVPGGGVVTDIGQLHVSYGGGWSAVVSTDDPVAHTVLYASGTPQVKVGDSPIGLGGGVVTGIGSSTWDLFGIPTWIADVSGAPFQQAVLFDAWTQFQSGASAAGWSGLFPSGSTWRRFDELQFASASPFYLMRGALDDPQGGLFDLSYLAVPYHCGSIGVLCGVDLIALEGWTAPGLARTIEEVRSGAGRARLDRSGTRILWSCDLTGATADDGCVYLTENSFPAQTSLLAREGGPSPVAGRSWGPLEDIALDVSMDGSWSLHAQLDASDTTNDDVLVVNGAVLAREGEVHPLSAPYSVDSLGSGPALLDLNGRVLWFARWSDPSTPGADEALFHEDILLVRTGSTMVGGAVLVDIESTAQSYALQVDNGRYVLFLGTLSDGTRGLFRIDQGQMQTYCTAKLNSAGCAPPLFWSGQPPSASSGAGFEIRCLALMAKQRAMLLYGTDGPASLPFYGGILCVAPPLRRLPPLDTGGSGGCTGKATIDFNAWIASGADPVLVPGQEVHAQLWYRDPGFPPPDAVGLTNALEFVVGP